MGRHPRGWTEEMDAALRRLVAKGLPYARIVALIEAEGLGRRSPDAAKQRAFLLGIGHDSEDGPLDCRRAGGGTDPLLAALAARHKAPPADAVPSPHDARPLAWRRLQPAAGCAGSPAAQCADLGSRTQW